MKAKRLSTEELSVLCMELSMLLHAAYPVAEGLHLLYEETKHPTLGQLCERLDEGDALSVALRSTAVFPEYLCHMVETGELTGRLEETFHALSLYYENRRQLSRSIRAALLYPSILLLLVGVVLVVLLAKVLPVFDEVFRQLGGSMTGLAGGLLQFGQAIDAAMPVLLLALLVVFLLAAVVALTQKLRTGLAAFWQRHFGDKGLGKKIFSSRFSSALSMGMMSGLPIEESLRIAAEMHRENPRLSQRLDDCLRRLEEGEGLAEALQAAEIMPPVYCRMLALGIRSGTGDEMISEISRRMEEDAQSGIDALVSRIEPSMVLITSLLVGMVLLSVMLPLMNIMSAIG